jgi:rare lipoprotein A
MPKSEPHYVLGEAYQAGGVWYYPHEAFDLQQTGIASVYGGSHPQLTADGEAFDPSAMAGAHQTVQLPAIARLTNLQNGLSSEIRINDRGPTSPNRLVAVTPRVAELLQFPPDGVVPVRLTVLPGPSHRLAEQLGGGTGAQLAMSGAPVGEVQAAELPPPAGVAASAGRMEAPAPTGDSGAAAATSGAEVPLRLPETLTREPVAGTQFWIRMGTFGRYEYARLQSSRVAGLGPRIDEKQEGRTRSYQVSIGPFATIPQADAALDQVIGAGVTDARIVVE